MFGDLYVPMFTSFLSGLPLCAVQFAVDSEEAMPRIVWPAKYARPVINWLNAS